MATTAKIAKELKTPKFKVRHAQPLPRCGRPRAYLRKFALCRLCFRKLALEGDIAGVTRAAGKRLVTGNWKLNYDRPDRRHARPGSATRPSRGIRASICRSRAQGGDREDPRSEGYIQGFKVVEPKAGEPQGTSARAASSTGRAARSVITGIQRVSRPGRRVYFGRDDVPDVLGGLGTSILTTSRGVMTGREAVKAGVGGEVLCNVW